MTGPWERRLARAETLRAQWPFAAEVLSFYRAVAAFQREVCGRLGPGDPAPLLAPFAAAFLGVVEAEGPSGLVEAAGRLRVRTDEEWETAIGAAWRGEVGEEDPPESFFARALLEPWAVAFAPAPAEGSPATCPRCGRPPVASVLREDREAQAVARALVCSLCAHEWSFPRVLCPGCREERPEKLARYTADGIPWIRVEACETCRTYLKGIDLTKEPRAEPVVDEIASLPLDVIARERGAAKLAPNLMGM